MNTKIFKIALSNVIKHKRRTFFNSFTFAAVAVALITLMGMLKGMYQTMYDRAIDIDTGHFKIYNRHYLEEKKKLPLNYNIDDAQSVIAAISGVSRFVAATPRINAGGIISDMKNKTNIVVCGIDMKGELKAMKVFERLPEKYRLAEKGYEVLVGKKLSEVMGEKPGEPVLLYSQTVNKANNLVDATVKGIYSIGFAKLERSVVFMPIESAQEFLDMPGKATEIIIRIDSRANVFIVKPALEKILAEKYPELELRDWKQENEALIAGARADYFSYAMIFAILLFLAVFIIMNTLTINVYERTAEIGTLRAIGLESSQIGWMFLWEGLILSLAGAVIGGILALPVAKYMSEVGLSMSEAIYENMPFPIESLTSMHSYTDWLFAAVICMVTGLIGAVLPSMKAAKTDIVDALKKGVR